MIAAQIIEMLQIQNRMNRIVNPEWLTADYCWTRAVMVEAVEILDHIGWKWWKKQEPNLAQARIELVDIWHFLLSQELVDAKGNIQEATLSIMDGWQHPFEKILVNYGGEEQPVAGLPLQEKISILAGVAGMSHTVVIPVLRMIAEDIGMSDSLLFELYMSKNALNQFRQSHGYKEGTYLKMWHGREDNEVLQEIIDATPTLTFQGLLNELEKAYTSVLAAQQAA